MFDHFKTLPPSAIISEIALSEYVLYFYIFAFIVTETTKKLLFRGFKSSFQPACDNIKKIRKVVRQKSNTKLDIVTFCNYLLEINFQF